MNKDNEIELINDVVNSMNEDLKNMVENEYPILDITYMTIEDGVKYNNYPDGTKEIVNDNFKIIEIDKIEIYDIEKDFVELRKSVIGDMIKITEIEDMYIVEEYFDYMIINSEQISQKLKNIKSKIKTVDWITTFKNLGFTEVEKGTNLYKNLDTNGDVLAIDLTDECDTLFVIINPIHIKFIIREDGIPSFQSLHYRINKTELIKEQFKLIQQMFNHYNKER
jgi:hypothetical protein